MLGSWLDFKRIQWLGGNRGFGITDKLLGFYTDFPLEINQYIGFNVMKSIEYIKSVQFIVLSIDFMLLWTIYLGDSYWIIGNIYFGPSKLAQRAGSIDRLFDRFPLSCSFGSVQPLKWTRIGHHTILLLILNKFWQCATSKVNKNTIPYNTLAALE